MMSPKDLTLIPDSVVALAEHGGVTLDALVAIDCATWDGTRPLTPFTATSFMEEGIAVSELLVPVLGRPPLEETADRDVMAMRLEIYEKHRQAKIAAMRAARAAVMANVDSPAHDVIAALRADGGGGADSASGPRSPPRLTATALLIQSATTADHEPGSPGGGGWPGGGRSTTAGARARTASPNSHLAAETKRLAKLREKQQREIQQFIDAQRLRAKLAVEQAEKQDAHTRTRSAAAAEQRALLQRKSEEQRRKEVARLEAEAARAKEMRAGTAAELARQLAAEEARQKRIRDEKRAAEAREAERVRLAAEFKAAIDARHEERYQQLLARKDEMERLEKAQRERAEAAEAARLEAAESRRLRAEAKRRAIEELNRTAEAERLRTKDEYEMRMAAQTAERDAAKKHASRSRMLHALAEYARRKQRVTEHKRTEEERLAALAALRAEESAVFHRNRDAVARAEQLRRERQAFEAKLLHDAIVHKQRREQYQRLLAMRETLAREHKTEEWLTAKREALQRAALQRVILQRRRAAMVEALDKARRSGRWEEAERAVADLMAVGGHPDDEAADGATGDAEGGDDGAAVAGAAAAVGASSASATKVIAGSGAGGGGRPTSSSDDGDGDAYADDDDGFERDEEAPPSPAAAAAAAATPASPLRVGSLSKVRLPALALRADGGGARAGTAPLAATDRPQVDRRRLLAPQPAVRPGTSAGGRAAGGALARLPPTSPMAPGSRGSGTPIARARGGADSLRAATGEGATEVTPGGRTRSIGWWSQHAASRAAASGLAVTADSLTRMLESATRDYRDGQRRHPATAVAPLPGTRDYYHQVPTSLAGEAAAAVAVGGDGDTDSGAVAAQPLHFPSPEALRAQLGGRVSAYSSIMSVPFAATSFSGRVSPAHDRRVDFSLPPNLVTGDTASSAIGAPVMPASGSVDDAMAAAKATFEATLRSVISQSFQAATGIAKSQVASLSPPGSPTAAAMAVAASNSVALDRPVSPGLHVRFVGKDGIVSDDSAVAAPVSARADEAPARGAAIGSGSTDA